jgi:hypothetical protein
MVNANLGDIAADVLRFLHSGKSGNHLGCGGQHPSLNQLVPVFQIAAESCCQKTFLPQYEAPAFMSNELIAIATRPRPRTAGRTRPTRPQSSIRAVAVRFCILQFYIKIIPPSSHRVHSSFGQPRPPWPQALSLRGRADLACSLDGWRSYNG